MYKASSTFSKAINYADDNAGWVRYRDIVDIINEEAEGWNKINAEVVEHQQNMLEDNKLTWEEIPTVTNEDINKLFRVENEILKIGKPKGDKPIIGQDDVGNIPAESAFLLVYAADGDGQIIKIQTLDSPIQIFTSGKQFMSDNSKREATRWVEALDRLIEWRWVKSLGYKGDIFELTGTGYNKADWLKEGMGIDTSKAPLDELKEFET